MIHETAQSRNLMLMEAVCVFHIFVFVYIVKTNILRSNVNELLIICGVASPSVTTLKVIKLLSV